MVKGGVIEEEMDILFQLYVLNRTVEMEGLIQVGWKSQNGGELFGVSSWVTQSRD